MSNLLILVKILTALYQVKKLNDKTLLDELMDVLKTVPVSSSDVFVQDKKIASMRRMSPPTGSEFFLESV